MVALYRIADVCLVTSIRDGMNLVACEYIASQIGKYGVLILSEFAGSAQSLNGIIFTLGLLTNFVGAILVNPWNLKEINESLKNALTINEAQKISDHSHLLAYVKKFTSINWGQTFVSDLLATSEVDEDSIRLPSIKLDNISEIPENSHIVLKCFRFNFLLFFS